jgi:hypothetical protein
MRYCRETRQEIVDGGPSLKMVHQSLHRDASPGKARSSVHHVRIDCDYLSQDGLPLLDRKSTISEIATVMQTLQGPRRGKLRQQL